MVYYKTEDEIDLIRESSLLVAKTHAEIAGLITPGVTTLALDKIAEEFIMDNGGKPAFKDYNGFPNTLCMSPNNQIVHGIPNDKILNDGDILSVDCGVFMNGYYGDSAFTYDVVEYIEPNYSLSFDGGSNVDMGDPESFALDDFTISFWFHSTYSAGSGDWIYVLGKQNSYHFTLLPVA